jgi:hypothetical protein
MSVLETHPHIAVRTDDRHQVREHDVVIRTIRHGARKAIDRFGNSGANPVCNSN